MTSITTKCGRIVIRDGAVGDGLSCCPCEMPCEISLELTGVPLIYSYGLNPPYPANVKFDTGDPIVDCDPSPEYFIWAYQTGYPFPGHGQLVQPNETVTLALTTPICGPWVYQGYMTRGATINGGVGFSTLDCGGQKDQLVTVTIDPVTVSGVDYMEVTIDLPNTFLPFVVPLMLASFLHGERLTGGEQPEDYDPYDSNAGQCVLDQLSSIDGRRVEATCPTDLLDRTYPMQLMLTYKGFIYQPASNGTHTPPPNSCETSIGLVYVSGINATLSYPPSS